VYKLYFHTVTTVSLTAHSTLTTDNARKHQLITRVQLGQCTTDLCF